MKTNIMWFIHNMLGHPLMEILWIVGARRCAVFMHDITLPKDKGDRV